MNKEIVTSIRILPSDKTTFSREEEFRFFIENTMITRGGAYYFPNLMVNCPKNTFVLFQYDGMIRAIGVLIDFAKTTVFDERGVEYAGYYKFDTDTLVYLETPISKENKLWTESFPEEKLDVENGLLLCPNHDKLFDGGWISFDDDRIIMISNLLQQTERVFMNIREDMQIVLSEKK